MTKGTALITGASGGIGLELARIFAAQNYNLVLVARSENKLREIANELQQHHNVTIRVLAKDLSQPSAPDEIFHELQAQNIPVDVLVNNAGFGSYGPFWETPLDNELQLLQLNIVALTHLTKLFLPGMRQRRKGKILNVASTAAFQPGPLMAVYYASKAYVLSFSQALSEELRGSGVTVTALCPGPTTSGFQERAAMQSSKLIEANMMTSRQVAVAGFRGLMRGKDVIVPGLQNKALGILAKYLPTSVALKIVKRAQEQKSHL
jgi:uncharacterized protein